MDQIRAPSSSRSFRESEDYHSVSISGQTTEYGGIPARVALDKLWGGRGWEIMDRMDLSNDEDDDTYGMAQTCSLGEAEVAAGDAVGWKWCGGPSDGYS